jgi:hypothetical protein
MQFRLRTLLILLAILPPLIAWWGWPTMQRMLWPPKPEFQFQLNIPAMGSAPIAFDFAFPVEPAPPPADNSNQDSTGSP